MPSLSRVSVMDPVMGREIRVSTDIVHVRRWDNVVHVVDRGPPAFFYIDPRGAVLGEGFVATMTCGKHAKMYPTSRNRFTTNAATCLVCVVGGYPDES